MGTGETRLLSGTGRPATPMPADALSIVLHHVDIAQLGRIRRAARAAAASAPEALNHDEAVELVTAELLANAFEHGRAPFEIRVSATHAGTAVAVRDGSPDCVPTAPMQRWRGMGIIDRLSTGAQVDVHADAKWVRAFVPLDAWARHRRHDR